MSNDGLVEISVSPEAGKVVVKYKGTKIQHWSWRISISAVLLMLLILIMQHAVEKGKIQSYMEWWSNYGKKENQVKKNC